MKRITIIGCGPGNPAYILPIAVDTIREQQFVCGSPRLLNLVASVRTDGMELPSKIEDSMALINSLKERGTTGILVSGDPSVFSISSIVERRFPKDIVKVIPGIGAGQMVMTHLGINASEATLVSLHGRAPGAPFSASLYSVTLFYMGGDDSFKWLDRFARTLHGHWTWYWCQDISLETERTFEIKAGDFYSMYKNKGRRGLIIIVCKTSGEGTP